MACLELRFFGGFDVAWHKEGNPPQSLHDFSLHKVQALLAYLVLHEERAHTRAYLAGLLWPDVSEEKARTSLRTALAILRKQLELAPGLSRGAYIYADELSVRWQPTESWWCDAVEFAHLIEAARQSESPESLEKAIALHSRLLLDGWYDDWVMPLQERWQQWYIDALEHLIGYYEEHRDPRAALAAAQRLLLLDPLREDAHRAAMRAYATLGERAAVREQYYRCKQVLATQLRINPSKATLELYRKLMTSPIDDGKPVSLPAGAVQITEQTPAIPRIQRPAFVKQAIPHAYPEPALPLIGREQELAQLVRAWKETRQSSNSVVLLEGEAGIGKTRLIQALTANAAGEDTLILSGGAYSLGASVPFSALLEAIRAPLLESPSPQLDNLAQAWRAELAMLWPALWSVWPGLTPNPPLPGEHSQLRLFEALTQLLLYTSKERPVLLVLEDMHWADSSTISWLGYVLRSRRFSGSAIMLMLTLRPEDIVGQPALQEWRRMILSTAGITHLILNRLPAERVSQLVGALVKPAQGTLALPDGLLQRLFTESDGNPLFVVELVKNWQATGALQSLVSRPGEAMIPALSAEPQTKDVEAFLPLPQRLQLIIAGRLARLSENAQVVLRYAAATGQHIPASLLLDAAGLKREDALAALEELLQRGVLLAEPGDQLTFSHEKLRETVYTSMTALRQRAIHGQIADVLARVDQAHSPDLAEQLAYHYSLSDKPELALEYEIQAGDRASSLGALPAVARSYMRALNILEQQKPGQERDSRMLALFLRLFPAIYRRDPPATSLERLKVAEQLAIRLDNHAALAEIYLCRGRLYFISGKQKAAEEEYHRSLAEQEILVGQSKEPATGIGGSVSAAEIASINRGWTYMLIGQSLYAQGNHRQAYSYLLRSLPDLEMLGSTHELGRCNTRLAGCCFYLFADYDRTQRYLLHAQKLAEMANDRLLQSDVALSLAHFRLRHSNWKEGLDDIRHAQLLAEQAQDTVVWLLCLYMGGYAAFRQGDLSRSRVDLEQAVASMRKLGIKLHFGVAGAYLAELLVALQETERGMTIAREAYTFARDNADFHSLSVAARILGTLLLRCGATRESEQYLLESMEICRRYEILPFSAETALALAEYYHQTDDNERAQTYRQQACNFYIKHNMMHWLDQFDPSEVRSCLHEEQDLAEEPSA